MYQSLMRNLCIDRHWNSSIEISLPTGYVISFHLQSADYPIGIQDLKPNNILFNYQVDIDVQDIRPMMARLGKEIRFVLCDFNISKVYSPDTPPSQRVVSSEEGECGTHEYHPPDVIDSCLDTFDPFAFDVACLGGILCQLIGVCEVSKKTLSTKVLKF